MAGNSKKKRTKFLNDRKRKRRKKRQPFQQPVALALEPFKMAEKLVGCEEALSSLFIPANGALYRIVHSPLHTNDEQVQAEQIWPGLAPSMNNIPDTIELNCSIEEQFEHIRSWSLSFSISDTNLAHSYQKGLNRRKTKTQKENYVKRKGEYIAKFNFTEHAGLQQKVPDDDGHTVIVMRKDFSLFDYFDKDYGFHPINEYINNEE